MTDLTNTKWLLKKPSEWVYGGVVPEGAGITKLQANINYTFKYGEYVSAPQFVDNNMIMCGEEGDYYITHLSGHVVVIPSETIIENETYYMRGSN